MVNMEEQKKLAVIMLLQREQSIKDEVQSWGVSSKKGKINVIAALQLMGYWNTQAGGRLSEALLKHGYSKRLVDLAKKAVKEPVYVLEGDALEIIERVVRQHLSKGVGYNDVPNHSPASEDKTAYCPWNAWQMMLRRCFSQSWHDYKPTYKDCKVAPEFFMFSNFKRWYDAQPLAHTRSQLDKDILLQGNKFYSPETCVLVPSEINILLKNHSSGEHMKGVTPKAGGMFFTAMVRVNKQNIKLGEFKSEKEAHSAYCSGKEAGVQKMAKDYFAAGKICQKTHDGLMAYRCDLANDAEF